MDKKLKLKQLEEKLARYRGILAVKKKNYRGVIHENSLSELRHTEYMVYRDIVEGLEREIADLRREAVV